MTERAGTWNRVKAPELVAGVRVISSKKATNAKLAASNADDDSTLYNERRARNCKTFARICDTCFPFELAGRRINRN